MADTEYDNDFESPTKSEASPVKKPAPDDSEPASPAKAVDPSPTKSEAEVPPSSEDPEAPPADDAPPAKDRPSAEEPSSANADSAPPVKADQPSDANAVGETQVASPAGGKAAEAETQPKAEEEPSPTKTDASSPAHSPAKSTPPRSPTPSTPARTPSPDPTSGPTSPQAAEKPADANTSEPTPNAQNGEPVDTSAKRPADDDPDLEERREPGHSSATQPVQQSKIAQRKRLPPRSTSAGAVATVSYPGERPVAVADILDPTKPLVKSTKPLTRPLGPSFVEEMTAEERRQRRLRHKATNADQTLSIAEQRNNERKYLKAQQEFEREKRLAERAIYHRERVAQWATRLGSSPLGVDLVADHERIDEEAFVRQREERRRRALAEKRKRRIKNEIIVKALAEVPLLEEARRQKRDMLEEERREKALRDVQRVEAIQSRKLRDMALMKEERQAKLDQRLMNA